MIFKLQKYYGLIELNEIALYGFCLSPILSLHHLGMLNSGRVPIRLEFYFVNIYQKANIAAP